MDKVEGVSRISKDRLNMIIKREEVKSDASRRTRQDKGIIRGLGKARKRRMG